MASNRVVCGPTFRDERGFLLTGDRGEDAVESEEFCGGLGFASTSVITLS